MFIKLFLITFFTSVSVSFLVNKIFAKSIRTILAKLVQEKIAQVFTRYVYFAIYVIGLSGGVNIYSLERYLNFGPGGLWTDSLSDRLATLLYLVGALLFCGWWTAAAFGQRA